MSHISLSKISGFISHGQEVLKLSYGQDRLLAFVRAVLKDTAWFLGRSDRHLKAHDTVVSLEKHLGHISSILNVSRLPHKVQVVWRNIEKTKRGLYALHHDEEWQEGPNVYRTKREIRVTVMGALGRVLHNTISIANFTLLKPAELITHIMEHSESAEKIGKVMRVVSIVTLGAKGIVVLADIIANKHRLRRSIELIIIIALATLSILAFTGVPIPSYVMILISTVNALVGLRKAWLKPSLHP